MYNSLVLGALFASSIQQLASAQVAQFTGKLTHSGTVETDGTVLVTIENTSTSNYSIEARNNLFDDANPYRPVLVKNLKGTNVALVGTQYNYGPLTDAAFITMSPGAVWQRELNMTGYIPPDPTATTISSQCFSVGFPSGLFAVNTTNFVFDENLATGFLKGNTAEIFVKATPLHLNITVSPGKELASAAATATVGAQAPASLIQGTATGLGGAAATYGSSIDGFIGRGTTGIFAKKAVNRG